MKQNSAILFGAALFAVLSSSGSLFAQGSPTAVFTNLHNFTALSSGSSGTNSDGASPGGGLVLSGTTLFGPAALGGSEGSGTLYAINTDGTGFTNLHTFSSISLGTNSDGADPFASLAVFDGVLYGTAYHGGTIGNGTVFRINTNGSAFTTLSSFTNTYFIYAYGGVIAANAPLTVAGGSLYWLGQDYIQGAGPGGLFSCGTDGSSFSLLYTNFNPATPQTAGLVISGSRLYGTTLQEGEPGSGTVFAIATDGTGRADLYTFTALVAGTNSDGAFPQAGLVLSGNKLYGTTASGGSGGNGTVFAVNTDGLGFTNLHSFTSLVSGTNDDGAKPGTGSLVLSNNTLYGTTSIGGTGGNGTVFAIHTDGSGFVNLYNFSPLDPATFTTNDDGATPGGALVLSANTLYGTTGRGGSAGNGTVYGLFLSTSATQLAISRSGGSVILTWPADAAGFTLQSTTNLLSPTNWSAVSPGAVVVNGMNTATNLISGSLQYYRLIK